MTFSGCVSYCKDTCDYNEYFASVYNVLDKLVGIMSAFKASILCFVINNEQLQELYSVNQSGS